MDHLENWEASDSVLQPFCMLTKLEGNVVCWPLSGLRFFYSGPSALPVAHLYVHVRFWLLYLYEEAR